MVTGQAPLTLEVAEYLALCTEFVGSLVSSSVVCAERIESPNGPPVFCAHNATRRSLRRREEALAHEAAAAASAASEGRSDAPVLAVT